MRIQVAIIALCLALPAYADTSQAATTLTLSDHLQIDCSGGGHAVVSPETHTAPIQMNAGDTLYVSADVEARLWNTQEELAQLQLACGPYVTAYLPGNSSPDMLSQGASNLDTEMLHGSLWYGSVTFRPRAIYTASTTGLHSCWLIQRCSEFADGPNGVEWQQGGYLAHSSVNQYPGKNWLAGSRMIIENAAGENRHNNTWDAGTATQYDGQVTVMWHPYLNVCNTPREAACDNIPDAMNPDPYLGINYVDSDFTWRIVVEQQKDGQICHKNTGPFHTVHCEWVAHHCGEKTFEEKFPIKIGTGSHGDCGDSTANRQFKVRAELMKTYDGPGIPDFSAEGGTFDNISIYSSGGAVELNSPGTSRNWGDGTYAKSCYEYMNPPAGSGYLYAGDIGDGVYRVDPTGSSPFDVYCDQTTEGGGWTLLDNDPTIPGQFTSRTLGANTDPLVTAGRYLPAWPYTNISVTRGKVVMQGDGEATLTNRVSCNIVAVSQIKSICRLDENTLTNKLSPMWH